MSQHIFYTRNDQEKLVVILGWDRVMKGYFMMVRRDVNEVFIQNFEDVSVYHHYSDPGLTGGFAKHLSYFIKKAEEIHVTIPQDIINALELEEKYNLYGIVRYWYDGTKLKRQLLEGVFSSREANGSMMLYVKDRPISD